MTADARVGLYFCPEEQDPLFAAGAAWLGRNPATGAPVPQPPHPGIEDVTAEARGYGFHATLKPPMRLAAGMSWFALLAAADGLAGQIAPFDLPPLAVLLGEAAHADRKGVGIARHGIFRRAAQSGHPQFTSLKNTAKKASSTMTVKIAMTTADVVRLPTSSALDSTCMP